MPAALAASSDAASFKTLSFEIELKSKIPMIL